MQGGPYPISSLNQPLPGNKILQIFWIETHFHELVPNFAQFFLDTLKMGMKQGLEGETKAQTQDDFRDDT